MMKLLKELERELALSPVHKILLTIDGSVTRILEALRGEEIKVDTEKQEMMPASAQVAKDLGIAKGSDVNYRIVNLRDSKGVLVRAISHAPISRLGKKIREDIMRKDAPIGKILSSHNMEVRREIMDFGIIRSNGHLSRVFGIAVDSPLLTRRYRIIHKGKPLIFIQEIFPYETFR